MASIPSTHEIRRRQAETIQDNSQTRTWRGSVVDADTTDGTCLVRVAGRTVRCSAQNVAVEYGAPVILARMPGSAMPVIVSGASSSPVQTVSETSVISVAPPGSAPSPHTLYGEHHEGQLDPTQAAWALKTDGTRQLTGSLDVA